MNHLQAIEYDARGDLVRKTDTRTIPTPAGITKLLQRDGVKSVEVHFDSGDSVEFRPLP